MDSNNNYFDLKKASLIMGVAIVLGVLFDYFFYRKIPGLSFPIYIILIVIGLFLLALFLKKKIKKQALWLLIPLLFFSIMVFVRSSVLLTTLNILASFLILLMVAETSFLNKLKNFSLVHYLKMIVLPLWFVVPLFKTLANFFSLKGVYKTKKTWRKVGKGVLITVPIIIIFLLLFVSADLIFQKHLKEFFDFDVNPENILRTLLVIVVALIFIGAYSYLATRIHAQEPADKLAKPRKFGQIELSILLGSINALFLIFIIVQIIYLFGGESTIVSQGFTYAEYARKGFFELIAIAFISLILLISTERHITQKEDKKHTPWFKILSSLLIVQVIVIMVSAFTRLSLYEQAFGFTTLRLYSHAFTIFVAVIFLLLLYKILTKPKQNQFPFQTFICIILFLATMNLMNPDAFIARKNIQRFEEINKIAAKYLAKLSFDAVPQMLHVLPQMELENQNMVAYYLKNYKLDYEPYAKWQALNISQLKAEQLIAPELPEIQRILEAYKNRFDLY